MPKTKTLTDKQKRFVEEYPKDLNATKSAERAGYSAKTASRIGPELLGKTCVKDAIARVLEKRSKKTEITADRVLLETGLLAFSDITHYRLTDDGEIEPTETAPDGAMRAISSVKKRTITTRDGDTTYEVEFKLWNKPEPLKLAGRHVGLKGFADRVELTGKDGKAIQHQVGLTQQDLDAIEARILGEDERDKG